MALADEKQLTANAKVTNDEALMAACVELDKIDKQMHDEELMTHVRAFNKLRGEKKGAIQTVRDRVEELYGPFDGDEEREIVVGERFVWWGKLKSIPSRTHSALTRFTQKLEEFS